MFLLFLIAVKAYIKFDTSFNGLWNKETTPSFYCKEDDPIKTQTISFSQAFAQIPQIFFILEKYDINPQGSLAGYNLSITSITKTNFDVKLECNTTKEVYRVTFYWYAYDDQRIQVINVNAAKPENKTFSRINPNADTCFVTLHGFQILGAVDFEIKIDTITDTNVSVMITNPSGIIQNLQTIGYSIVLGINEAFIISGLITATNTYNSPPIPIQTGKSFLVPFVGITFTQNTLMELAKSYSTSSGYQYYTLSRWDGDVQFTATRHKYVWLLTAFTTIFKPMKCKKLRSSSFLVKTKVTRPLFQVQIQSDIIETQDFNLLVDKTDSVKILITHACQQGKTIRSYFMKCWGCNNYNQLKHFCHSQVNTIVYEAIFSPPFTSYQELQVVISETDLQVQQIVYNQYQDQSTILQIVIQN